MSLRCPHIPELGRVRRGTGKVKKEGEEPDGASGCRVSLGRWEPAVRNVLAGSPLSPHVPTGEGSSSAVQGLLSHSETEGSGQDRRSASSLGGASQRVGGSQGPSPYQARWQFCSGKKSLSPPLTLEDMGLTRLGWICPHLCQSDCCPGVGWGGVESEYQGPESSI